MCTYKTIYSNHATEYKLLPDKYVYYGYKNGTVVYVGFDSTQARENGNIVEKITNPEFTEIKNHNDNIESMIMREWYSTLLANALSSYHMINELIFNNCYEYAYERGHSSGYCEVELFLSETLDFVAKCLNDQSKN